ncbi:MAG: M48 family metalloprotease [Alphaproteobacteria bacterium]|nr:M48 family metalloprotease [Alphaproteobacteria bacterium]
MSLYPINIVDTVKAAPTNKISFIRDSEIENIIRSYATPIFSAANLEADSIPVYIIEDENLNAFVAGGMKVFIHTGLLMQTETPNQLIGVIAHETGHIAGGHLARAQEQLENATIEDIIATVLGIGAVVAGGIGGAGMDNRAAGILLNSGAGVGLQSMLQHTRTQEAAADQAALSYLDRTGQSSKGFLEFFQILKSQENMLGSQQNVYLRSHPLTEDRIKAVREHFNHSPFSSRIDSPQKLALHQRMKAKLIGYFMPLQTVLQLYPESNTSDIARYARAFAYYRSSQTNKSIALMDNLLQQSPNDPYYNEFKGQILFETGHNQEALPYYQKAVDLLPNDPLLRLELGRVEIESENPQNNLSAITNLERTLQKEPDNSNAWRLLSIAYGRSGNLGMAALALAEEQSARGHQEEAKQQAERALKLLPYGSPGWLRAQDIQNEAKISKNK